MNLKSLLEPEVRFGVVALCALLLSGCGLWGVGKWSTFSITLAVHGVDGAPIEGVSVNTTTLQEVKTGSDGKAVLYYDTKGLYVITLSKAGLETTQIKVTMPIDDGREIFVQLAPITPIPLREP